MRVHVHRGRRALDIVQTVGARADPGAESTPRFEGPAPAVSCSARKSSVLAVLNLVSSTFVLFVFSVALCLFCSTASRSTPCSRSLSVLDVVSAVASAPLRKRLPRLIEPLFAPPPVPPPVEAVVLVPELEITDLVHNIAAFHFINIEPADGRRFLSAGSGSTPGCAPPLL